MKTTSTSSQPKLVKRYSTEIGWYLDGETIEEAIARLKKKEQSILLAYPDITHVKLVWDQKDWDEGYELTIRGYSAESSEEKKTRLAKEKEDKERLEDWDRKQFEILKKKFQ